MKGQDIRDQFGVNQWLEQQSGHHVARPGEAVRNPARAAAGPLGPRHRGRGAPHVGRRRVAQEPALPAGRAAARQLGPHAAAHGDPPQGRSCELQPVPAAPRRRRLRRREVHPRGDGPPARAVLPAPHQGGDGLLPRAAGGRHLGGRADLHQAHSAHGRFPDRRRRVRPLPRRDALREARERPRRGPGRRPARPRDRLPDVPLPAPARVEHLRHAPLAGEPRPAARRGSEAGPGARAPGAAGPSRSGRAGGNGGKRARAAGGDAGGDHARRATPTRCAQEIQELRRLAAQAQAVEEAGAEAKLSQLKDLLAEAGLLRPPGPAPAPLHRVQGHAGLPRRATEVTGASASAASTAA